MKLRIPMRFEILHHLDSIGAYTLFTFTLDVTLFAQGPQNSLALANGPSRYGRKCLGRAEPSPVAMIRKQDDNRVN